MWQVTLRPLILHRMKFCMNIFKWNYTGMCKYKIEHTLRFEAVKAVIMNVTIY
jgi:hypothetical protein